MAAINNMIRKYGAMDPVFGQAQFAQILVQQMKVLIIRNLQ